MNKLSILPFFLFAACNESSFTQAEKVDAFQQKRKHTVDVILVVDNSCSMIEEQKKLATNFDGFIQYFDGTDVDWQMGVVTTDVETDTARGRLIGGDDEIVLVDGDDKERERVKYDHEWLVKSGQALSLDPSWFNAVSNDKRERWCEGAAGTPGQANPSCGLETEGTGVDARYGEIIVTEIMADPDAVADNVGEWIELTNLDTVEWDLSDWIMRDDGRNSFAFPAGSVIAPGGTLVLARSAEDTINGGVPADIGLADDFTLNNDVLLLGPLVEGPAEIFAEMVAQGTSGSGLEQGLESVKLATAPDMLAGHNAGLVRADANLTILIVSDEEDSSPDPVDAYLSYFAELKGDAAFRDHSIMNVSGVIGADPPEFEGEPSCRSSNGAADYGHRYVDAIEKTGGLVDSICDDDFAPIVAELGLILSGLLSEFELSRYPDIESLKVGLYATDDTDSKIRDLTLDTDFTYVEERNSIRFEQDQVPESEQYIVAEYQIRSGG